MFKVTRQTLSATSVFFFQEARTPRRVSNLPLGAARSFFSFFFFVFSFLSFLPFLSLLFNNILDDAPVRSAGRFAYIPVANQPIDSTQEDGQTPSLLFFSFLFLSLRPTAPNRFTIEKKEKKEKKKEIE